MCDNEPIHMIRSTFGFMYYPTYCGKEIQGRYTTDKILDVTCRECLDVVENELKQARENTSE